MRTSKLSVTLALALGSTLAACSPSSTGNGVDAGSGGPGPVNNPPDAAPLPYDLDGTYNLKSTYNLSVNTPGTVGTVIDDFLALTSEGGPANAPTQWIYEQIANQIGGQTKNLMESTIVEGTVVPLANNYLLENSPDAVKQVLALGQDLDALASNFQTNDTLQVTGALSIHTVEGIHLVINGTGSDLTFAANGIQNIVVPNVGITMDASQQVAIAKHDVMIPYGTVLRLALDHGIIPALDSHATNLGTFLADEINCSNLATELATDLSNSGVPIPESILNTACIAGLNAGASFLYSEIAKIDASALDFQINGNAAAADTNGDRLMDQLNKGVWQGNLIYGTASSVLAPATFSGARQ